jgi:hypothetical protein
MGALGVQRNEFPVQNQPFLLPRRGGSLVPGAGRDQKKQQQKQRFHGKSPDGV